MHSCFWQRPDYLSRCSNKVDADKILKIREERFRLLEIEHWDELRSIFEYLNSLNIEPNEVITELGVVSVGSVETLSEDDQLKLKRAIEILIPWRKGPFSICGQEIDAEWRSDIKWERIAPHLEDIENKKVADIGCNNGYYMYRLLEHNPKFVLGMDPSDRFLFCFELLQIFSKDQRLAYDMLGVDEADLFPEFFDTVLCMGVLYHRSDPIAALKAIKKSLKPGGQLIVECQAIEGEGPYALFPRNRYAKARNVFFVPTADCIVAWLTRVGFKDIEVFSSEKLNITEQRKTPFAPYESLEDFLDKDDPSKTFEGYPAPIRVSVKCRKALPGRKSQGA